MPPKKPLLSTDLERSDAGSAAPSAAAACGLGPALIITGAALFACTNAASTALFRRGGTVVTLYLLRCAIVYPLNGALVAARDGRAAAIRCLLCQTGSAATAKVVCCRSLVFSTMSLFMCFGYILLHFSDAFTVMKGVDMLSAVIYARACMGRAEGLSLRELACGALTLAGIALIAQPPFLFGRFHAPDASAAAAAAAAEEFSVSAIGLATAALAGTLAGGVGVLTRVVSAAGGAHDGRAPPTLLLSNLLVAMTCFFGGLALVGRATGLADAEGMEWIRLDPPRDATDWALILVHCAFVMAAQLTFAAGYRSTRAGIAAFLQLTELAWVYLLDVYLLGEPTNLLASMGTAVVFASAVAAARSDAAGK